MASIKTSYFYRFISALWREWVPLATGSGIVAVIALIEHYLRRNLSWVAYEGILIVFVGRAAYQLWKKQYDEIERLKVRPYDQERLRFAAEALNNLSLVERDFIRLVLLMPDVTARIVNSAALIDVNQITAMIVKLAREGWILRKDDPRGSVHYSIPENWRQIFQDRLFPRQENQPAVFRGLSAVPG